MLSQLIITKEDDLITISDVTTEPIINYYDSNLRNFQLIPYHLYTEEMEINHYRYDKGFTKEFVLDTYQKVIPKEFQSF